MLIILFHNFKKADFLFLTKNFPGIKDKTFRNIYNLKNIIKRNVFM